MCARYLIDTAIWIDLYEDRKGYNGEPLGEYAWKLLRNILASQETIIVSDLLLIELETRLTLEQINGMFIPFQAAIEKVFTTEPQSAEAEHISEERNVPRGDALHAIHARDHQLILITRDRHFKRLSDIAQSYRPEEFI